MNDTTSFMPQIGKPLILAEGLRLILAPNPSPMTHLGTNTYILGTRNVAIIDPGPDDPRHLTAILKAVGTARVTHILLTHSHLDHSALAPTLADRTGAKMLAFGPSSAGRSAIMNDLAAKGLTAGGEGVDEAFLPDSNLRDGEKVTEAGWEITAHHTPGHMGNHLCFETQDVVFTGDLVMGWSTSLVSPPDGDLTDFMTSCRKLQKTNARIFYPGHGAPVENPRERLNWLLEHRKTREAEILNALVDRAQKINTIVRRVYADLDPMLWPAAERNVFAHLIDLHQRNAVQADPSLNLHASFRVIAG